VEGALADPVSIRQLLQTLLLAAAAIAICRTTADPDLWGHVRFGQDMLAAGTAHVPDTYSFTSDHPWINHEWLAEIVMALSFDAFGPAGLNVLRLAIAAIVLVLVWRRLETVRAEGMALPLVAVAALGIFLRVHPVRPQLFSVLFFAVLLSLLTRADDTASARPLMGVPVLMAAWVNFHGAWIVGLGTLLVWSAGRLAPRRPPGGDHLAARRPAPSAPATAAFTAAGCLATLVNPYVLGLWRFLAETVGPGRPFIADWQPMLALPLGFWGSWIVPFGVAALAFARARGRLNRPYAAIVVLLGAGSLRVSRLDAFFALAVVFLLSPILVPAPAAGTDQRVIKASRKSLAVAGVAAVCAAVALGVVVLRLPMVEMNASLMPEPEVARYVRATHLSGRMLTWFDWGEYAIWHFGPDIKVSMDGRRETVYSDKLIEDHLQFYSGHAGTLRYPESLGADYVWIPARLPIVSGLRSAGWHVVFDGPASTILARHTSDVPWVVRTVPTNRLFPGP
jgi:hypothetical protein